MEGRDEAVVDRCGEVEGATHGTCGAEGERPEHHLIKTERDIESATMRITAELIFHEVAAGELDAGEVRNAIRRLC